MHQPKQLVLSLSALLLLSSLCSANLISTCLEVGCPIKEGTTSSNCQVSNQTLITVGVTSYSVSIPGQDEDLDLAWTVGGQNYDNVEPGDGPDRYIERVYYLGTPSSVDLTADDLAYDGCAFYLTGQKNENLFYKNEQTYQFSSYCQESLTDDCISSLTSKLSSLAAKHTLDSTVSKTCSEVASDLQSDILSSCPMVLKKALVRGVALTGPTASGPLTESQNSSSNCYPTLPKSNELTRQFSYNISSSMDVSDTAPAIDGETPIISMFWSNEGDQNATIENPAVQLTCLRPVDVTAAAQGTSTGDGTGMGNGEGGGNGAIPMNGGSNILRAVITASTAVLFFSWLI